MRHKSFTTILAVVMMAVGLFSGSAMAGWPTSIAGTWTGQANQVPLTIDIRWLMTEVFHLVNPISALLEEPL